MGIVESAQILQDHHYHQDEMRWNRRAFNLDSQALNLELVNTIRDDLRDLISQRAQQIDNVLLVNTLLFSFSFGFVCEGTFPVSRTTSPCPPGGEASFLTNGCLRWYPTDFWLRLYVTMMVLTFVLPFWSIWFALECKSGLDAFLNKILREERSSRLDFKTWTRFFESFEQHWARHCRFNAMAASSLFWGGMVSALSVSQVRPPQCLLPLCQPLWCEPRSALTSPTSPFLPPSTSSPPPPDHDDRRLLGVVSRRDWDHLLRRRRRLHRRCSGCRLIPRLAHCDSMGRQAHARLDAAGEFLF